MKFLIGQLEIELIDGIKFTYRAADVVVSLDIFQGEGTTKFALGITPVNRGFVEFEEKGEVSNETQTLND